MKIGLLLSNYNVILMLLRVYKFDIRQLRSVEEGISVPGDNGCLLPLPRVSRNPAYITKEIIVPDDGYV